VGNVTGLFVNVAAYKFVELADRDSLRRRLSSLANERNLKGTILLASEGINLFIAGTRKAIDGFLAILAEDERFADIKLKESLSDRQPFNRMLVRLKREIISFGIPDIDPRKHLSKKLAPIQLRQWLDERRPITLLDVRNDYEIELGSFENAFNVGISHFREFPPAVRSLPNEFKETPLVMFCTGGIRCEKAGPLLERAGFQQVYQLDGGILKYFEQCGGVHFRGECFVFDQRVALDRQLVESATTQCFACQSPLLPEEQQSPLYVVSRHCPRCYERVRLEKKEVLAARQNELARVVKPLPGSGPYENRRPMKVPLKCDKSSLIEFLTSLHPHIGTSEWMHAARSGVLLRGGRPISLDDEVRAGQRIDHLEPNAAEPDVNVDIEIIDEDESIIVVNKPAPLPMHPCGRFNRNTLQYILQQVYSPHTPRPAHRLDANTSGVVVLSKTRRIASRLQPQFERGEVTKQYLARVHGWPDEQSFRCDAAISRQKSSGGSRSIDVKGKPSVTEFTVLERYEDGTALCKAVPITGRTNQIRLHLMQLGHPVCGDPVYRRHQVSSPHQVMSVEDPAMCLHAHRLTFSHPETGAVVTYETLSPDWANDDQFSQLLGKEATNLH